MTSTPQSGPLSSMTPSSANAQGAGEMKRRAVISPDGTYRYLLERDWDSEVEHLGYLMLNPSTADAEVDDQTIRKCVTIAFRHGYGGIMVANVFAYRATDPKQLSKVADPFGPGNMDAWLYLKKHCAVIVAGWGKNKIGSMHSLVAEIFPELHCLGTNKDGSPKHPCYLPNDTKIVPFGTSPAGDPS